MSFDEHIGESVLYYSREVGKKFSAAEENKSQLKFTFWDVIEVFQNCKNLQTRKIEEQWSIR